MSETFMGSIAQKNVQFPIESVIEPLAGENYSRGMIFMPVSKAETYLPGVSDAAAGDLVELNANNYGSLTGGLLLTWLVPFFKVATSAKIGVAIYDDGESAAKTLATVYAAKKMYAYFKFIIADTTAYNDAQVSLSTLCLADELYSACWIGTSDTNVLKSTSALISALNNANSNARVIYNPDAIINPALAQLGRTLSAANSTGTPVGNDVDMVAFSTIGASGSDDEDGNPTNLTAAEIAILDNQKIGYNTYVGDGTSNVVTEGSLTLQGDSCGAEWVKNYITYMAKIETANYITSGNKFRNNATYQAILLILTDQVNAFVTLGRLSNFVLSAPVFADLPTSGDEITVANAWSAHYVDTTREVTVYGTLYITQPTR